MWVKFMMRNELKLEEPEANRAYKSAATIALSYAVGGAVPLLPYIFISKPHEALLVSIGVTLVALVLFGYIKSRFMGTNPWKGALRTAALGSIAAAAAYFIAKMIS